MTPRQIKSFLVWCKKQRIKSVKIADVEVEFWNDEVTTPIQDPAFVVTPEERKMREESEYQELLTWSSS